MYRFRRLAPFLVIFLFLSSCKTTYQPTTVSYFDYKVSSGKTSNAGIDSLLQPYKDSVSKTMNDVIAVAGMELEKKQPEGTLNDLLADAMLYAAKENYKVAVDAAFVNYGGVRLNSLPKGDITRGKVFEVAPFDNIIVLLKVNGDILQQFLDITAARGGWPCAGLAYQIKNKKAVNVLISGKAIDPATTYTVALLDYIANGGDDCELLRKIPQQNNGYLFRDGVISYLSKQHREGKQITVQLENRVSNAE